MTFGLPKPGKALIGAMLVVTGIWVFFAAGMNYAGAGPDVFALLVGSDAILEGEVWRLVTSFLVHRPSGAGSVGHLLTTLLGLYFLGGSLEERWGPKRFIMFLLACGVFAAAMQVLVGRLVAPLHQPVFFGALGVIDAIAIAWALSFRGRQVRLFFVLPVSGSGLILFVVGVNVLYLIGMDQRIDGLVTPFGGMLAGWMGADGSPVRNAYLRWKLGRLGLAKRKLQSERVRRAGGPELRVIRGGGGDKIDKNMLN